MDQQTLKIYRLTTNLLANQAIYAKDNDFRTCLPAMSQLSDNETVYHDKVLIKIYKSQKFEWFLFAI
jgi:hypothetical protein